jgi:putative transposase
MEEPVRARLRRWYAPDAIYFIVAVTQDRQPVFAEQANIDLLRETMRQVKILHPFAMHAYAFMPEHLHLLIFVPERSNISAVMQSIEWNYTRNYKAARGITASTHLWQRGFWDHVIRDDDDLQWHMDYIHYNPVKHGLTRRPLDYAHTSFHEYVRRGWYEPDWGCDDMPMSLRNRADDDCE